MNPESIRVGFILGPTGVGKSAFAIALAERLGAEIVNADSRLLYRALDIGTAKPSPAERARVPHHLLDVRSPAEPLDVAEFRALAAAAIAGIAARGRPILVTGGSGLYIRVLRSGIFAGPPASPPIRRELNRLASERGVAYLHDQLRAVDPETARRLGVGDLYRIVRALEVFRLTGVPISMHQRRHGFGQAGYDTLSIALNLERERLYQNINHRFDQMIAAGFVDEVRGLLDAGYAPDRPPLATIGYKHVAAHLRGELSLDAAIALAKRDTRRLAKRQLTWLRGEPDVVWVDAAEGLEPVLALLRRFFSAQQMVAFSDG